MRPARKARERGDITENIVERAQRSGRGCSAARMPPYLRNGVLSVNLSRSCMEKAPLGPIPVARVAALLAPGGQMQGATTKADHPAPMGRVGARAESIVEEERHRTTSLLRRLVPVPRRQQPGGPGGTAAANPGGGGPAAHRCVARRRHIIPFICPPLRSSRCRARPPGAPRRRPLRGARLLRRLGAPLLLAPRPRALHCSLLGPARLTGATGIGPIDRRPHEQERRIAHSRGQYVGNVGASRTGLEPIPPGD